MSLRGGLEREEIRCEACRSRVFRSSAVFFSPQRAIRLAVEERPPGTTVGTRRDRDQIDAPVTRFRVTEYAREKAEPLERSRSSRLNVLYVACPRSTVLFEQLDA